MSTISSTMRAARQLGAWQYGFFVYGGNFPWRSYDSATMELARKQDAADFVGEKFSDYAEDSQKYAADLMPALTPTVEEADQLSAIKTDVDTYVEMSAPELCHRRVELRFRLGRLCGPDGKDGH